MKQQSEQWFKYRLCRITASRFGDVLAKPTTNRYQEYMNDIIDAIKGVPDFRDDKPWFQHGNKWEPEARGLYEWETDNNVKEIGIIQHPKYDFISCSPDGITGKKCIEIKSHKSLKEFDRNFGKLPSNHVPQVQGVMWISKKKECDFISYYRNESGLIRKIDVVNVLADKKYHKKLEASCLDFWEKIKEKVKLVNKITED